MSRSAKAKAKAEQLRCEAWKLHCQSIPHWEIADRLGIEEIDAANLVNKAINIRLQRARVELARIKQRTLALAQEQKKEWLKSPLERQIFSRRLADLKGKEKSIKAETLWLQGQRIAELIPGRINLDAQERAERPAGKRDAAAVATPESITPSTSIALGQKGKLVRHQLLEHCIHCYEQRVQETSICLRAGYRIEEIGSFRREFARAAAVQFGPLERMIRDFNHRCKASENERETEMPAVTTERRTREVRSMAKVRGGAFRDAVLKAHGARCACCSVAVVELIEAAHLVPVSDNGSDHPSNGLPLCPLHHAAFDRHFFGIDPASRFIAYREGFTAEQLRISEQAIKAEVSEKSLEIRMRMFMESVYQQKKEIQA